MVPDQNNPQAWDRYAYTLNNPLRNTDPSGHWPWPSGNQIQFNIALGLPLQFSNLNAGMKDKAVLLYYSLSLVTDDKGGVQLYGTTRDQTYNDGTSPSGSGFVDGPAEAENPSDALTGGISIQYGAIDGSDFRRDGTWAYDGKAVDDSVGISLPGSFSPTADRYVYADPATGVTDPSKLTGYDVGWGWGAPFSVSHVATNSSHITERIQLPTVLTAWCKVIGMCGSYPGAGPEEPPLSQDHSKGDQWWED